MAKGKQKPAPASQRSKPNIGGPGWRAKVVASGVVKQRGLDWGPTSNADGNKKGARMRPVTVSGKIVVVKPKPGIQISGPGAGRQREGD